MASIFKWDKFEYLNIDATVGEDGVNNHDDVYLLQALLYEVLLYKATAFSVIRPAFPTGVFNYETKAALAAYKQICNKIAANSVRMPALYGAKQNKVYYDKHIDPIRGSIFAFGTNVLWAIARLNSEISDLMFINNHDGSVKDYMFKKYPDLIFMFR